MRLIYSIIAILFFTVSLAQNSLKDMLSAHVYYLADEQLEGRLTGSKGEELAMNYIAAYFKKYGLEPKGTEGFIQPFEFSLGKKPVGDNTFSIGDKELLFEKDFFPMPYSGNGKVRGKVVNAGYGIEAPGLYNDFENLENLSGKILLINLSSPDGIHPHSKYLKYTDYKTRIKVAESKGAAAIIFFNIDKTLNDPVFDLKMNVEAASIPVLFVTKNFADALKQGAEVALQINLKEQKLSGHNVAGYIDNKAPHTVVIGAHYDHLGYGEHGGSRHTGPPAIHHGADDNASGVALMIELAPMLKKSGFNSNNYLFLAFSAEELGLIGSKYFTSNPTVDIEQMNYMLNFDMVGRLDAESRIALNGTGTSPVFDSLALSIKAGNLNITNTPSGMGASDHTSFYLKDLPVIHFYTGNNPDYHKPSDRAHLINYDGMADILDYTYTFIGQLDGMGKLEFTKTKDNSTTDTPRFNVTLGVIPDYMFAGKGMKIDGVTEGKPADNAGIQAGDIVIRIGHIEITDMMSYMTALSKFQKGTKTTVAVLREGKTLEMQVEF
jgi:aminopeptidase YwaD